MSSSSVTPLPFCAHCFAVHATGSWLMSNETIAKKTEKLSTCARCHITRYCSRDCQRQHWSMHKVGCMTSVKGLSCLAIADMIKNYCLPVAGKIVLCLDSYMELASVEKSPEEMEVEKMHVDVKINGNKVGASSYLLCKPGFDWESKLEAILNPPSGIHNPGAQVELGYEMIRNRLYTEAFQMMADRTPPHYKSSLQRMFFPNAVTQMHTLGVDKSLIVSCARLLNKNPLEVEALILPPPQTKLPEELQSKITKAEKLPYGARDFTMLNLAKKMVDLGLYDQAFDLIFDWVATHSLTILFFKFAAEKMVPLGISHEKLVQLARSINLSNHQILNELVGIYPAHNQVAFACQLAEKSNKSDYYFEIIFSALLNEGKKEEARKILDLVSPAKRRDLEFYLR